MLCLNVLGKIRLITILIVFIIYQMPLMQHSVPFLYGRVLLCLKRSLRIANAAQQMTNVTRGSSGPVTLFVEILNKLVGSNSRNLHYKC